MAHILISAAHKSSGKTMVSTGLVRALKSRGRTVATFKKGPDYIDPKWLGEAAGRPCHNLDYHTQTGDEIRALFARHAAGADIAVIEGNKGLYDGVDVDGCNSNAALAKMLGAPVILVVDCSGITRGVAPLLMGYQVFDPDVTIAGVILNKVLGERHETKLVQAVERYTDIPVLGAVRRNHNLTVDERHLGLIPSNEHPAARARIETLGEQIAAQVDLDRIEAIAATAQTPAPVDPPALPRPDVRIAVAKDAAFGFYYADDLAALRQAGAQLVYFNAINDVYLPTCDGLFLGGGFPETQMKKLEANKTLRRRIKAAIEAGLPTYAECGGLMYLTRSISWHDDTHEMAGVIPADALMHPTPQGRGYVHLRPTGAHPWGADIAFSGDYIPAHEFHHSSLENIDTDLTFAYDVLRGHGVTGRADGIVMHNLVAGYAHMRDTSKCRWAEAFTGFVRRKKSERGGAPSPAQTAG
ncbi:MAG: cobyrinate a,c-diamide synthase [Alphaproteobacteria bacterium]|nr:cobyrinate a,c-diamide synthase [Alphaproteobacteria bacterium]